MILFFVNKLIIMSETSNNNLKGILKNTNNQNSDLLDKINEIFNNIEIIIDKKSIDLKKINEKIFSYDNFKKIFYKKLRKINQILRDKGFNDQDNILINKENNIKDFRNLIIHKLFEKSIKIKENIEFEDLSEYNNKSLFSSHLSLNKSDIKDYHEKIKNIREEYILIINDIKSNLNEETKKIFYDDFEYLEEKLKNFEVLDNKEKILNPNKEIIDFIERKSIINKIYNSLDEDKKKKKNLKKKKKNI